MHMPKSNPLEALTNQPSFRLYILVFAGLSARHALEAQTRRKCSSRLRWCGAMVPSGPSATRAPAWALGVASSWECAG